MAHIFRRHNINRPILSLILSVFTLTYALPIHAMSQFDIGFNEVAFLYRVKKLVEKIWKLEKSNDKDKMYEAIIDLKAEIEGSCGIQLNISEHMDSLERQLKSIGFKAPKKEFEAIRKAIKKKERKRNKNARYLGYVMHLENYDIDAFDEGLIFQEYNLKGGHGKKDGKEDDEDELYVPAQLVFGVTLALCGFFLMFVPFPACKPWGERMIASGVVICGNCISSKIDNDHKNEKDKEKK